MRQPLPGFHVPLKGGRYRPGVTKQRKFRAGLLRRNSQLNATREMAKRLSAQPHNRAWRKRRDAKPPRFSGLFHYPRPQEKLPKFQKTGRTIPVET